MASSIYIAAPWVRRDGARAVRAELIKAEWKVTSRWLDAPDGAPVPDKERGMREAAMDLEDISNAEAFLVLTDAEPVGAGHHVELGYALALGKLVIVAGPIKSVFHYLAGFHFPTWEEARLLLIGQRR